MKNILTILLAAALLLVGSRAAQAQRNFQRNNNYNNFGFRGQTTLGGGDPRIATNIGLEIIQLNNIFDPNRVYRPPVPVRPVVPPPQNFTLTGVMTYGPKDMGYSFFSGNAVTPTRGYMAAETINGYKIAEITNNTVKLVDTNNNEYVLRVGAGFSRSSPTNAWRFLNVPEPTIAVTSSSADLNSDSASGPTGPMAEIMKRLMAKRAAEEGAAGGGDTTTNAPPDDGSAPATPDAAPSDNPPAADSATNSTPNSTPTPAPAN